MGLRIMGPGAEMVVFNWERVGGGGRVRVRDAGRRMRMVVERMREWRGRCMVVFLFARARDRA